jgi:hypothetical protein
MLTSLHVLTSRAICALDILLGCCSVPIICLLFLLYRTIIYIPRSVSRLRTVFSFSPRPILPAATNTRQVGRIRTIDQSIDGYRMGRFTLLKPRGRLSRHVTAPRWNNCWNLRTSCDKWAPTSGSERRERVLFHSKTNTVACSHVQHIVVAFFPYFCEAVPIYTRNR